MATSNGPWQNRARIEWVYTISGSGSSRTVSVQAYLRMDQYASQYHGGTKSWSGQWGSGSGNQAYNLGPNERVLIVSGSPSVPLNDTPRTVTFSVSANHYHGVTGSTLSVSLPAKVPSTPTSLAASRNSDTSHTLTWTRNSTYTAVVVQRRVGDGQVWSAWSQVGRPTGNAYTYTDTTTQANRAYQYRVSGVSAGGQSGWSNIPTVYTTPAAVTAVAAQKVGTDIEVTATGLPPYATEYRIEDNGVQVATGVTSWPWLHSSPNPSITHTYTVYSERGSLRSAGTVSNTVQLQAPPLAPSQLVPNGGVRASDEDVRFSWLHNPVDTSAQTEYRLQHRAPGGAWTTLTGTTAQFRDVTLPVGAREWQVQTRGAHASFGPYSAVATVTVISRPGVAVQGDPATDTPVYTVVWDYFQAEGRPQSAWQVRLLDSESEVIEQRSGAGATTSLTLNTRLVDGATYTVQVRAATGDVWSAWSPLELLVEFVPPAQPVVSGGWDDDAGTVELTVTAGDGDVAADVVTIERSVDGGEIWEPWITAADFTAGAVAVTDHQSLSRGVTLYRVSAIHTVTGAAALTEYQVVADSLALWLSGGVDYATSARLPYNPTMTISGGRSRDVRRYMGRPLGVAYAGGQLQRTFAVGGLLRDRDGDVVSVDALMELAQAATPLFMLRDADGRRVYGVLSELSMPREKFGIWNYEFTLEETSN